MEGVLYGTEAMACNRVFTKCEEVAMTTQFCFWLVFFIFVLSMLWLDLAVFHRRYSAMNLKEALLGCAFWISLGLLFNLGVYLVYGQEKALEFLTGYVVEYSLSVDNMFVFILIFSYFSVPPAYQHKVLFWGIIGALIMRGIFIGMGVALIERFHFIIYIFGALLVVTGIKIAFEKDKEIHPEKNPVLKLFRRFMPVTRDYVKSSFFTTINGCLWATPMFVTLLVVETTDVIFAVDSVPAVLAITLDPFVVYTSNVFAILGLRSLFFVLAALVRLFYYLNYGVATILVFVGVKMLIGDFYKIAASSALLVIASILFLSIIASVIKARRQDPNSSV